MLLTYHSENPLPIGSLVQIPLGKRSGIGLVFEKVTKPAFETRPLGKLLEASPLPPQLLELAKWMSEYYATPIPTVLQTMLPRGLGKARRATISHSHPKRKRTKFVLNEEQKTALKTIDSAGAGTVLLRGITGSGKTQVYIEHAKKVLEAGKSVIILVPEIALTSQLVAEFSQHFDHLLVTHSTMTEATRHLTWRACLEATEPTVVIGPRSALFSPLKDIGLIVVDECHEPAYKQEQAPRYSALRVGSVLTHLHKAPLVLGSATPSITDTYLALETKRPIVLMNERALKTARKPEVHVVDMTKKSYFTRHRFFSNELLSQIEASLSSNKQSLIFHNRRGSAPLTICENCGYMAACPRCLIPLTLHSDTFTLKCHVCGHSETPKPTCPQCGQPDIIHKGIGTKSIEEELKKLFPKARVARYDADAKVSEQVHSHYQQLYDGDIDIIVGTQVIAKGLDLPHLNVVGIVQADGGLSIPDYQSQERVFQLIYQVSGRVGRNFHPSSVIVQTYQPTHPSVQFGVSQDYEGFYDFAIAERKRAHFPPYTHLLKLTCSYKSERAAVDAAKRLAADLRQQFGHEVQVFGPTPSFYERLGGNYRWQLLLKSQKRELLIQAASVPSKTYWYVDLDPANIL